MTSITKYEQQNKDLETLRAMAAVAVRSGKYNSADYNEATVLNIFMTARALGVDPMLALNGGFNIIKGKINMAAHFMSALARRAGHSMKVIEMTDQKCTIIAKRKDNEDSLKYEMTMEEARLAGLTGKDNWNRMPKQMLYCACVRNIFRILFSDIAIPYDADEMNVDDQNHHLDCVGLAETTTELQDITEDNKIDCRPKECSSDGSLETTSVEKLESRLAQEGVSTEKLSHWLELRAKIQNKNTEFLAERCLIEDIFPKFKASFLKWLESLSETQEVIA